jgi:hypothetical protein
MLHKSNLITDLIIWLQFFKITSTESLTDHNDISILFAQLLPDLITFSAFRKAANYTQDNTNTHTHTYNTSGIRAYELSVYQQPFIP